VKNKLSILAYVVLTLGLFVLLIAGVLFLVRHALDSVTGFDRQLNTQFESVQPGMGKAEVLSRMGNPRDESATFRLGQRNGYEHEYHRAAASDSKRWLFWYNGIDVVYAVGFDTNNVVTMKASGGT
jgi:hypothetical protein